jgi:Calcineurin-like phosphoesterase
VQGGDSMPEVLTAVISDLHLGKRNGSDLLRRPELRALLMAELERVDHLVLLGDTIELRDAPLAGALQSATPLFEELGETLPGRRVTVVPGNHDYQLARPWLGRRPADRPLGLEELSVIRPRDPLHRLARSMPRTELVLAYPGLWLREDVYATHGHYLDCHARVLTFECMARMVSERLVRAPSGGYRAPPDYEAVLSPLYRLLFALAQSPSARVPMNGGKALVRRSESVAGERGRKRGRTGIRAMAEVVERLGVDARHILFGHLHSPGPLPGDTASWRTAAGTQLVNTGSWVYEPGYLGETQAESPDWPGTCAFLERGRPPELRSLLRRLTHDELRAGRAHRRGLTSRIRASTVRRRLRRHRGGDT